MNRQSSATLRFGIGGAPTGKMIDTVESFCLKVLYINRDRCLFDPHLDGLQPHFVDANEAIRQRIHSVIVHTRHHHWLVDTSFS